MIITLNDLNRFSPLARAAIETFLEYIRNGEKGNLSDLQNSARIITDLPERERKIAHGIIGRALEGMFLI